MSAWWLSGPGVTPRRYLLADDGCVFDTLTGVNISRDLWDRRLAEGRSDTTRHEFRYLDEPPISIGGGFYCRRVRCDRCGEEREVASELALSTLNLSACWCVPISWWQRFKGAFR
jgi:hypothetical protein